MNPQPRPTPEAPDPARFGAALAEAGLVDAAGLRRAERVSGETGERVDHVLSRLGLVGERDMAQALAAHLGLPLVGAADFPAQPPHLDQLGARFLAGAKVMPLGEHDGLLRLAMADPMDTALCAAVALRLGRPVQACVATLSDIDNALERLGTEQAAGDSLVEDAAPGDADTAADVARLRDQASEAPVIRLVNLMIRKAAEARASDIHLEPFDQRLRVRFRIDGALREQDSPPPGLRAAVISRLKIMAKLNIAEQRLPQDGRIKIATAGREIDLRVATVPTLHGEGVVMRLLDRSGLTLDFDGLGLDAVAQGALIPLIARPNGILLVTGPTGSGKTTTLYAAVTRLNAPERKIITVEDPVEYQLPGINQIQVKPQIGLTFAHALRSILRQDPDVIMIGEIRDLETARIAVQAALTGHLVLATLHTNNAASAIDRLRDMGVEEYLIGATLVGVVAQRLVRRLCSCAAPSPAGAELARRLDPEGQGVALGPVGCPACGGTGYRGRTGVIEVLGIDDGLRRAILDRTDPRALEAMAVAGGMRSMVAHGMARVRAGETSVDEVMRVAAGFA